MLPETIAREGIACACWKSLGSCSCTFCGGGSGALIWSDGGGGGDFGGASFLQERTAQAAATQRSLRMERPINRIGLYLSMTDATCAPPSTVHAPCDFSGAPKSEEHSSDLPSPSHLA